MVLKLYEWKEKWECCFIKKFWELEICFFVEFSENRWFLEVGSFG